MTSADLDALLAGMVKAAPTSRRDALERGYLVDCTQAAAWCGFQVPVAMSWGAWQEVVGHQDAATTAAERLAAGERLRAVWMAASRAVLAYKHHGVAAACLRFTVPAATGRRNAWLVLRAGLDGAQPVLTLTLEGES